jgi:hypothetical protein
MSGTRKSRQLFLHQSREETRSNRQCSVVEIVIRVVHGAAADRASNADIDKGARTSLKHVCKIFSGCNETSVPIYVRLSDKISRSIGNELCLGRIVDQWGEDIRETNITVAPKAAATPVAVRRMPSSICFMVSLLNVRNVPLITAVCGMTL